ncbi:hypothetical protein HHK36_005734 [Tetracentron sinense]|uniref:Wax synthase domain-containing protein n=1 Tax=Tetracentron sinense TaxID=13715 RepID=A0A834ZUT1_TETSI|nr:hypothetical protein HHK36_005734 [Tetracentron sinense]
MKEEMRILEVERMEGDEIKNFIMVWLSVFTSLIYCYSITRKIPKGKFRFLTIFPIICLFTFLPLNLSTIHLGATTAFFIAWLANFKLLLFSFGQGPLSSDQSITFARFISIACLPIMIREDPSHLNPQNKETPSHLNPQNKETPSPQINQIGPKSPLNYAIKGLLVALLIHVYEYSQYIHPKIILLLYCFHAYFSLEIILAIIAALTRSLLGLELEPQFDEPYLSTSLQDFWGKRWNLMVSSILRPTVYVPIRSVSKRMLGRRWAPLPALLGTFIVSGLMHELIFYYLGRQETTWEVTWFFVLHGICLAVEIEGKKWLNGKWRLPRLVSGSLTFVFVVGTTFWLFLPQFMRCGAEVKAIREFAAMAEFAKDIARDLGFDQSKSEVTVL